MRRPSELVSWLSDEELQEWVREAKTSEELQRRLAIWLTHFREWSAKKIAEMIGVSVQAVWLWVGQYNRKGPQGLFRSGRGGRRWSFLSLEEEEKLLKSFEDEALKGKVLTVKQLHARVERKIKKKISLDYVYRLLRRHHWRKLGPRPRHVKNDPQAMEVFKKNFPIFLPRR